MSALSTARAGGGDLFQELHGVLSSVLGLLVEAGLSMGLEGIPFRLSLLPFLGKGLGKFLVAFEVIVLNS